MFKYIPKKFAPETADTEEEAARWLEGKEGARRPPELLTRDEVARSIKRKWRKARLMPHGGVFLDIASKRSPEFIRKKLPSMYHQFKELAELDITKEPMEVGPTMHYFMGGSGSIATRRKPPFRGSLPAANARAACTGPTASAAIRFPIFWSSANSPEKAPANISRNFRGRPSSTRGKSTPLSAARRISSTAKVSTNPFLVQEDLQDVMQKYVGIIRTADELKKDWKNSNVCIRTRARSRPTRARNIIRAGTRFIDLPNLLITSEAVTRAALMREESRGGHTRADFYFESDEWLKYNVVIRKAKDGNMEAEKIKRDDPPEELKKIAYASLEELEGAKGG